MHADFALSLQQHEKEGMKRFFARECADIVGALEANRFEQHEHAAIGVARLQRAGFTPIRVGADLPVSSHPTVTVAPHKGCLGIDYRSETLVAVLAAVPAG